jgi:hypothetical protein
MRNTSIIARGFAVALLALASSSGIAAAQQPERGRFELHPFAVAFVPTGAQSNSLKSGAGAGIQGAYAFNRYISAVGTFAWSGSEDKAAIFRNDVNVYQYDIGAEAGIDKQLTSALAIRPFLGLGMGGRAYDYDDRNTESQYNVAGYGAGGAELMMGRFGWRFEVRDYVSGFKGLNGELDSRRTRNDLSFSGGFTVHF